MGLDIGIVTHDATIEDVHATWAAELGRDLPAYRGHVYRTYNLARALGGPGGSTEELAVVAAFHDLGIWSDRTFDYLGPSAKRAVAYINERSAPADASAVARSIALHHRLRPCRKEDGPAAEAFRRADLIDVSLGLVRFGLPGAFVRETRAAFPNAGFHRCLLREATRWMLRHPLRPLPMITY